MSFTHGACIVLAVIQLQWLGAAARASDEGQARPSPSALEELLNEHESTVEAIISGDVEIVAFNRTVESRGFDDMNRVTELRWKFDLDHERVSVRRLHIPHPHLKDASYSAETVTNLVETRSLLNFDPRLRLTPGQRFGASGGLGQSVLGAPTEPHVNLKLAFQTTVQCAPLRLRKFAETFRDRILVDRRELGGSLCWRMRLLGPEANHVFKTSRDYVELWLDPGAGCLVRRVIWHWDQSEFVDPMTGRKRKTAVERDETVEEFQQCEGGAFIPKRVHWVMRTGDLQNAVPTGRIEVNVKSLNEPIDAGEFELKFPEHMQVNDAREGDEHQRLMLWGANDQPLMEIKSIRDLEQFAHLDERPSRSSRIGWWVSAGALLIVGYLVYRRRRAA